VSAALYCSHYSPPVATTPVANLPPLSLIPVAKFAAGFVDTGGTNLREFSDKIEITLMLFTEAWGKVIHEKKPEAKNPVTLSL
jgi:hypothetical protein